jgi:hypothetical protein
MFLLVKTHYCNNKKAKRKSAELTQPTAPPLAKKPASIKVKFDVFCEIVQSVFFLYQPTLFVFRIKQRQCWLDLVPNVANHCRELLQNGKVIILMLL